jgi:hypothetical protein
MVSGIEAEQHVPMRLPWLLFYCSMALSGKTFHTERARRRKREWLKENARGTFPSQQSRSLTSSPGDQSWRLAAINAESSKGTSNDEGEEC